MSKTSTVVVIIILILVVIGIYYLAKGGGQNEALNENTAAVSDGANNNTASNFDIQGMKVEILTQGSGDAAKTGDTVTVNYVGTLENDTKFDSSIDRGQPFSFTLGQNSVIQGWELGVTGMKIGEKRRLTIPPELAYGSAGAGGVIPPNATLIFEVDMLGIDSK